MKLRKYVVTLGAAALLAGASMVAFAAWTATGTGNGAASAITPNALGVSAGTATACLYPGKTGCPVAFTVTNNNPYAVNLTQVQTGTITSSDETNCPAATHVTGGTVSFSGSGVNVPANTTTPQAVTSPDVLSMNINAPNGCKGVTFTVALTVTGQQPTS